ncbi:tyrosine-protein kinase hopscotch [Haemaphysalis longicornis]
MVTANEAVRIHFYTPRDPLAIPSNSGVHIAEDLCVQAAEACGICPITCQLFGLYCSDQDIWFAPSAVVKDKDKTVNVHFRLRFKPPNLDKIKEDDAVLDYLYHQMRQDFVCGRVPELHQSKVQSRTLGLVITDVVRHLIELGQSPQQASFSFSDYMPPVLVGPWKMRVLKTRMTTALNECWQNSRQNAHRVKEIYVNEFSSIVPEYACEQFAAQVDANGRVWEVILQVNPYHTQLPGLRMRPRGPKENVTWTQICSISDLCFVNMVPSNCTVEISRRNGIPQNLKFDSISQMHSFVSLLDGYYRLTEKWTVNLCINLLTPSLTMLRAMRCHGPVGARYAYQKLQEKGGHEAGWYLIRQSSSTYREYRLDFLGKAATPETLRIVQLKDGRFALDEAAPEEGIYPTLARLISEAIRPTLDIELGYCVPPSEYDKTQLLLCRAPSLDAGKSSLKREPRECIHSGALVFTENRKDELPGKFTVVRRAYLHRERTQYREVAVKALKPHLEDSHLKEFMVQCDRMLFWQCEAIVCSLGMVHSGSFGLVCEFLPLGSLDAYLRHHRPQLQPVDLVEAAKGLARALWYLEEQGCVHGKIRCRNILVSQHEANAFYVKLSDPGLLVYMNDDVHWIPPEFYNNLSMAKSSIKADTWAFGTTLWEIFSYGEPPMAGVPITEAARRYREGERLPIPADIHEGIGLLLQECWSLDPDSRPQPQTIMRDINQIFYEVYNSRRSHSYASVYPQACSPTGALSVEPASPVLPGKAPSPSSLSLSAGDRGRLEAIRQHHAPVGLSASLSSEALSQRRGLKWGKNPFRLRSSEVSYDNLSSCSTSTVQSEATLQSDIGTCIDVESLVSLEENADNVISFGNTSPLAEVSGSPWVIDSQQLIKGRPLGQGFFGEVYAASLKKWAGLQEEVVAVKCMRKTSLLESFQSEAGLRDLQREIEIMKSLRHPNIVEIKGLVEEPEMMLVMEFLEMGSLLTYLQTYRDKVTHPQLIKYSEDIANGMEYLEEKRIVHRDLAARNILVASKDQVKISDFGLAQFTVNHYYYIRTQNRKLPMKWYAPESILYGKFSSKSDVWSYGVTLWEMFSYGEDPVIQGVTQESLGSELLGGKRLACPPDCPTDLYQLMLLCWATDAHQRPSFARIKERVRALGP